MCATTIESIVSSDTIWPVVCNIFTTIMEQGFVIVDIVRHIVKQHLRNRQLHPFLPFLVIMGKEEEAKSLGSTIYWRDNRKLTSHTLLSHLYCHIFFAINFFWVLSCFFCTRKPSFLLLNATEEVRKYESLAEWRGVSNLTFPKWPHFPSR